MRARPFHRWVPLFLAMAPGWPGTGRAYRGGGPSRRAGARRGTGGRAAGPERPRLSGLRR
ncbi:hypothetical protein BN2537_10731 [Streptomyces venezuelae]|nr:hypothetical protein BN2537_10731 [Streptomyces venezuelae]